jgi:integrative and conjugative element protein (TIGR02256 family)
MQVIDEFSRTRVRLVARGEILRTVARTTGRDGLEAGGVLVGGKAHDLIEVVEAGAPGPKAVRKPGSFLSDVEHDVWLIRRARDRGLVPVGMWHSHPSGYRGPSRADLAAFAALRELDGDDQLMLLLVPDQDGGFEFDGFVVSRSTARRVRL